MGRIRREEGMIYNFYAEFANTEEFTKINRSAEWKDVCDWCSGNGIRIGCFPVAIDDKIQAFFFCEVNGNTPNEWAQADYGTQNDYLTHDDIMSRLRPLGEVETEIRGGSGHSMLEPLSARVSTLEWLNGKVVSKR